MGERSPSERLHIRSLQNNLHIVFRKYPKQSYLSIWRTSFKHNRIGIRFLLCCQAKLDYARLYDDHSACCPGNRIWYCADSNIQCRATPIDGNRCNFNHRLFHKKVAVHGSLDSGYNAIDQGGYRGSCCQSRCVDIYGCCYDHRTTYVAWDCSWFDPRDRKSTRLNSSHVSISYAVLCL